MAQDEKLLSSASRNWNFEDLEAESEALKQGYLETVSRNMFLQTRIEACKQIIELLQDYEKFNHKASEASQNFSEKLLNAYNKPTFKDYYRETRYKLAATDSKLQQMSKEYREELQKVDNEKRKQAHDFQLLSMQYQAKLKELRAQQDLLQNELNQFDKQLLSESNKEKELNSTLDVLIAKQREVETAFKAELDQLDEAVKALCKQFQDQIQNASRKKESSSLEDEVQKLKEERSKLQGELDGIKDRLKSHHIIRPLDQFKTLESTPRRELYPTVTTLGHKAYSALSAHQKSLFTAFEI